ncbi:hypothetical protein GE09DRAFT_979473 [Coniochaeta sp. 2T2.1]|nr:hypothetical protein GE09DRAFT_979473 [Coniochaeta sp. 2T2.1]
MAAIHPYGWGLYKKVVESHMQPGCCGYFDDQGDWQLVGRINESQDRSGNVWFTVDCDLQETTQDSWGPKVSELVKTQTIGGKVGAIIPGTPAEAAVTLVFETQADHGCVVVVDNPVALNQVTINTATKNIPMWIRKNIKMLTSKENYRAQAIDHGLWVVTKTYTSRSCALAMMSGRSSSAEFRLSVNIEGLLVLDPGVARRRQISGSSIDFHRDDVGGEQVVVFMSGIYVKRRPFLGGAKTMAKQKGQEPYVRGEKDNGQGRIIAVDVGDEKEVWELEKWGEHN